MSTNLAVMDTRYGFTPEQVDVIKATIAPGATNEELALFLMVAQKTGLDPFSRQIYLSERRSKDQNTGQWIVKKSPETTIDGFRVIAERSQQYEGQAGPFWCGPDGEWKDVWLALDSMPSAAKVGVWRKGFREPVWGVALFEEYKQTKADGKLNSMWQKMGANQLAKCAEALALRKAFPRDLSGMYSKEEMAQAQEREPREAQQDVAQRKIKELSTPKESIVPGLTVETTHPSAYDYEQRQALILEANAVLDEATQGLTTENIGTPKPTRKKGAISFKALKALGEMKDEILKITGTTDLYYEALKDGGYAHANEIETDAEGRKIWKALKSIAEELSKTKHAKADEALLLEAQTHALRIGPYATQATLERHGLQSIDEILNTDGTTLTALLKEMRETA